jgi:hypothetical protein
VNSGLNPDRITATISKMRELGILEKDPPALDRLLDTEPITAALGQIGELSGDPRWR